MPKPVHEDTQPIDPLEVPYDQAEAAPVEAREKRSGCGCGCWVAALLTFLLVVALIGVGLFLPPINLYQKLFGVQYTMISANANAIASNDKSLTMIVDPADVGQGFGVALNAVPMEALNPTTEPPQVAISMAAVPVNLALQSPVYRIDTTGTKPGSVSYSVRLPSTVGSADVLDLYAWNATSGKWDFVPSHFDGSGALTTTLNIVPDQLALFQSAPQDQPTVLVSVDVTQTLTPDVAKLATIVAPAGLQPTLQGTLTGSLAAGFDLNAGYLVMPAIRNFTDPRAVDTDTVAAILGNSTLRSDHVTQLIAFARGGYDGVMIDYRSVPVDQRDNFSAFVKDLATNLHGLGLGLGVVVPAAQNVAGSWDTGAYDWRAIGSAADFVEVDFGLDPSAFTPGKDRLVEAMLRWGVGEVNRHKLLLGLSARSVQQVNGEFTSVSDEQALAGLGDVKIEAQKTEADTVEPGTEIRASLDGFKAQSGDDKTIHTPYIDYVDDKGNAVARMWLATADALRFRMDRTADFALRGVAFSDLLAGSVAPSVLQGVMDYKVQLPSTSAERQLALRWRIQGADGTVGEVNTGLNDPLVATIKAPDGNYAINVDVVGAEKDVPRSGAAVAVFAPTVTPTELPSPTPTATPEPTRIAATARPAAPPAAAAPAANAAGGIAVGNFEYGGQVTNVGTGAAGAMQHGGMNWMKVQIKYNSGDGAGGAGAAIAGAHSRGFKILLSVVGNKDQLAAGGDGYIGQYASFVGQVAAQGPDAIEVWNEANLDREWPTGQISGAAYVNVLRQAYQAAKGANGGVMIVSGAPAPTGAEAAFPGQVWNDNHWLGDVVANGGLQYMDCLGAHYNEGIIGPTQTGGDPRDGYYTRYFWGMVNTYWSITGGQKPICFTELGYLSPEGLGPLPGSFAWAANVTVAQQAAWIAQAAALASQSGKVRLMIVWNVDFSVYGSDPQAGYAIIRPGGGCPACDALASAR